MLCPPCPHPHPAPRTPHPAPRTPHPAPRTPHPAPGTPHPAPLPSPPRASLPPPANATLPAGPLIVGYYESWSAPESVASPADLDLAKLPSYINGGVGVGWGRGAPGMGVGVGCACSAASNPPHTRGHPWAPLRAAVVILSFAKPNCRYKKGNLNFKGTGLLFYSLTVGAPPTSPAPRAAAE
jgi:hypothetical protein